MENEIVVNKAICIIVLSGIFLIMFIVSKLRYHMNKHKIIRKKRHQTK